MIKSVIFQLSINIFEAINLKNKMAAWKLRIKPQKPLLNIFVHNFDVKINIVMCCSVSNKTKNGRASAKPGRSHNLRHGRRITTFYFDPCLVPCSPPVRNSIKDGRWWRWLISLATCMVALPSSLFFAASVLSSEEAKWLECDIKRVVRSGLKVASPHPRWCVLI